MFDGDQWKHTCRRSRKDSLFTFCSVAGGAAGGTASGAAGGAGDRAAELETAPSPYEPRVKEEFASPDMPGTTKMKHHQR